MAKQGEKSDRSVKSSDRTQVQPAAGPEPLILKKARIFTLYEKMKKAGVKD